MKNGISALNKDGVRDAMVIIVVAVFVVKGGTTNKCRLLYY